MKYMEAAIGGVAGAVISAAITLWVAVDEKLTQARMKEVLGDMLIDFSEKNRDSIREIAKAEEKAVSAVSRFENLMQEFTDLKAKAEELKFAISESQVEFDQAIDDKLGITNEKVADILRKRVLASFSLKDAVVAFNLSECPGGWEDYSPAYGRFLRGIDKSGKGVDPAGIRKHGNVQGDAFKAHKHYKDGGNENAVSRNWKASAKGGWEDRGDNETRPKNVAVMFCVPTNR